jgi:hypothetical protein
VVDRVHGHADDGAGSKVLRLDGHAAGQDDAGEVAGHGGSAAECFFDAGIEVGAGV